MTDPETILAILVLFLVLDILVVAARSSLLNVNLARLLAQQEQEGRARQTLRLVQTGVTLEGGLHLALLLIRFLIAGLLVDVFLPSTWSFWAGLRLAGLAVICVLCLFLLEEFIQGQVSQHPERWAIRLAPFARLLRGLFLPVLLLAARLRPDRASPQELGSLVIEDELKSLVDAGHQEGVFEQDEREMIYSIFRLGDTLVREIMTPRIYVTAFEADISIEQAVDAMLATGHSRVPVFDDTVDHILGVLYAKDLLRAWREGNQISSLRDLLRDPYFVPEAKKVDELLDELQARQVHMAIVVDEYGGVAGLVTMEDIMEEIVGEIRDEYDQAEEMPFQAVSENEYIFLGRIDLYDFNQVMNTNLPREEAETLGGFIYSRVGRVPRSGEQVRVEDLILTVEQVSGRRIRKVRARKDGGEETRPAAAEEHENADE